MPRPHATRKPRIPGRILPALALLVSLGLHVLWALPRPSRPERIDPPDEPALAAYPRHGSQVWSPILFSLPSATGFSGAVRNGNVNVLPPLQSPLDLTSRTALDPASAFPPPDLPPIAAADGPGPLTAEPEPAEAAPARRSGWSLEALEPAGVSPRVYRVPPPPRDGGPAVVTGVMEFDRYGQVDRLILDPGEPRTAGRDVTEALRRVRLPRGGGGPVRVRFRLVYVPGGEGP